MAHEATPAIGEHHHSPPHDDIIYPEAVPFVLVHLACFGAIWSGVTWPAVWVGIALYWIRMWAITAGFHRYFSHRSYKTSRFFQFVLAFLGQTTAQRGVIWWAAIHRHHHLHSDTPEDVHSPLHSGLFFSHVGWIFSRRKSKPDYSTVPDLTQYPELRWLNRHQYFPAALLAVGLFLTMGWSGLVVGFFWSTVVLYHCTFSINSLAHVVGSQRYVTGDDSRNNFWLALITCGEGWHNNHHHYQSSTRQGFYWWEVDVSYYVLRALSWIGLVWDLRAPPEAIVHGERRLGRKVIEKVAHDLAASFSAEAIAGQVKEAWAQRPTVDDLRRQTEETRLHLRRLAEETNESLHRRADDTRRQIHALLANVHLPHVPSLEELRARAVEMHKDTPSVDEIAERAREIILEAISLNLFDDLGMAPA